MSRGVGQLARGHLPSQFERKAGPVNDDLAVVRLAAAIHVGLQGPTIRAEGASLTGGHQRQRRLAKLAAEPDHVESRRVCEGVEEPGPVALHPGAWERSAAWPLLVLDAGTFLARCRGCSWVSAGQSALTAALVAFQAHVCAEPSP